MSSRNKTDPDYGHSDFTLMAMRQAERRRHHANTNRADRQRHDFAVTGESTTQRQYRQRNGKPESDFMNDGIKNASPMTANTENRITPPMQCSRHSPESVIAIRSVPKRRKAANTCISHPES